MIANPELERNSEAVSRIAGRLECYVWQSQARSVGSHHFTLQIVNVSDTDVEASGYEIPEKASSASSRIIASQWISNCTENHKKYRIDKISWLLTRLVNVGLDGGATRLIETKELSKDQHSPYFALSHRWGLFYTRTPDDIVNLSVKYKFIAKNAYQGLYGTSLESNYMIDDTKFAIYERAWVLQERLLSPRTINFSKQLIWECREKRASESFPMSLSLIGRNGYRDSDFSKDWRSSLQEDGYNFWEDTLYRYLKSSLTYPSYQLVALGAIAREYETELDDIYFVGLWKKELPLNLLWKLNGSSSFSSRPNTYRCPTWSWASLDIRYPARFQTSTPDGKALVEVLRSRSSAHQVALTLNTTLTISD
ncbi:hypothetical protein BOTNAR_0448g00040 [Botryotinia narcissicola]|uniref:Heterokaryon incompatibility domain-containing protein n=1 Tax=Botryotinia narcissicola TaxID=278944 RepID=A0A4Z1HQL9_9HELO|nr:hypothetical protein BOTNAR_0448g00040 [Botryotinia narcissicola]